MKFSDNNFSEIKSKYIESAISLCPEIINDNFKYVSSKSKGEILHLNFIEKSTFSKKNIPEYVKSKGFFPEITIDEIQIENQKVYITIKRRRWINLNTNCEGYINWRLLKIKSTGKVVDKSFFRRYIKFI